MQRTITWIALAVALATALAIPALYVSTAYTYESNQLEDLAERLAGLISENVYLTPDLWHFGTYQIEELTFHHVGRSRHTVAARILDAQGAVVYSTDTHLRFPTITRLAEISDGTQTVGRLELTRSFWRVWYRTGVATGFSVALAVVMFVTLRVLPLNALARTLHHLALSQHDLLVAQEELRRQERLAALGQVTATVSHELRNPLGSIRTSLFAIRRLIRDPQPMVQNALDIADRSITRCDMIISDLLDFTRRRELQCEKIRLDDWLATALVTYTLPPGITLQHTLRSGMTASIDQDRLYRAILNVLDNACQAMTDPETAVKERPVRVTVTTQAVNHRLEIVIEDTGPGIAPDVMERMFEALYSTKSFGVGLGLPIVKQIMEQHHGGIEVGSTVGHGTRVVLWLPTPALAPQDAA